MTRITWATHYDASKTGIRPAREILCSPYPPRREHKNVTTTPSEVNCGHCKRMMARMGIR